VILQYITIYLDSTLFFGRGLFDKHKQEGLRGLLRADERSGESGRRDHGSSEKAVSAPKATFLEQSGSHL
jgi:hypothetical protein